MIAPEFADFVYAQVTDFRTMARETGSPEVSR